LIGVGARGLTPHATVDNSHNRVTSGPPGGWRNHL